MSCACGCGRTPCPGRRFVHGHNGRRSVAERFWAKIERGQGDECWRWLGTISPRGYAMLYVDGAKTTAHRVAYELHYGPIPAGLCVDHLCRNRGCVNPAHLEAVTNAENVQRGYDARRTA